MGVALAALVVALALQVFRVLFPLAFDLSSRLGSIKAGLVVVAIFGIGPLLAPLVRRIAGEHREVVVGVAALAIARLVLQFVHPVPIWLAGLATAVALAALAVVMLAGVAGPAHRLAQAVVLGFALDVAVRGAFRTWDPVWQEGIVPVAIGVALCALAAWAATRSPATERRPSATGALALGPFLFLSAMFVQSPAFVASQAHVGLPAAIAVILVSDALALAAIEASARRRWGIWLLVGLAGSMALRGRVGPDVLMAVAVTSVGAAVGLGFALRPAERPGDLALALGLSGAGVLFLAFSLGHQIHYDKPLPFPNRTLLPAAAAVLAALAVLGARRSVGAVPTGWRRLALVPLGLLVVPLGLVVTRWPFGAEEQPAVGVASARLVDYNLHLAVNLDGQVDPETIARTIEAQDPAVVTLQEVGRGWPINGMTDLAEWLSWRLDMPYLWSPAADGQFGNAILTRLPIVGSARGRLPQGEGLMVRSYLWIDTDVGGRTIRIVDVHLQHRDQDTPSRLAQLDVLLPAIGDTAFAVLAGDMNSQPGSPEIQTIEAAGFTSAQDIAGIAEPTSPADGTIIDYIFVGEGLTAEDVEVPLSEASDHVPVVATIRPAG